MPQTSSLPPRGPTTESNPPRNPSTSAPRSIASRIRRMDAALFGYLHVCGSAASRDPRSQPAPLVVAPAKISNVFHRLSRRIQALMPRRLHEPTGPWGLILDMVLSLFVAQGACRSVINSLPLEVVGETPQQPQPDSPQSHDLESCGVRVPVQKDDKCAICLGSYEHGDTVRHLGCTHAFHAECVDVWLERKGWCPICKTDTC